MTTAKIILTIETEEGYKINKETQYAYVNLRDEHKEVIEEKTGLTTLSEYAMTELVETMAESKVIF